MPPVVWGLDLAEIRWHKFTSRYMFGNTDYHLRRTKLIVYQCAMLFCVFSESLSTAVLIDCLNAGDSFTSHTSLKDYVAAASYNIVSGIFVSFIFGAAFFLDLIWPERKECKGVRLAWKIAGVLASALSLSSAIFLTIITMSRCIQISRNTQRAEQLPSDYAIGEERSWCYRQDARAIASVVLAWVGWTCVLGSTSLLYRSIDNIMNGPGPKSKRARERDISREEEAAEGDRTAHNSVTARRPVDQEHEPQRRMQDLIAQSPRITGHETRNERRNEPAMTVVAPNDSDAVRKNSLVSSTSTPDSRVSAYADFDNAPPSESGNTTFSSLAMPTGGTKGLTLNGSPRRALKERSLADLTSGVADNDLASR